jgi:peptide/nickel transport system permease protein
MSMNTVSSPPLESPRDSRAGRTGGKSTGVRGWISGAGFSRLEIFGLVMLALILFLAVFGPAIAPHPTETANPPERLLAPSMDHWLGTDQNGMDVFSRILAAPRTDVLIAVIATFLSVIIGAPLGVVAGYFEGSRRRALSWLSEGILRLLDVLQAFPVFIFAMVLVAIRGASMTNIILAAAFVNMPTFLRLVRGEMLSLRGRPFAEAARAIGGSDMRIAFRHLLPNALPPVAVQMSVTVGFTILLTAGLSFVGAGISPPTPELGSMISAGAKFMISGQWWPSLFPGIALGLIVFTFGLVGETIGRLVQPGGVSRAPSFEEEAAGLPPGNVPIVGTPAVTDVELGR